MIFDGQVNAWPFCFYSKQVKSERLFFLVILVTHPNSYIQTTDRRDFGGKLSNWRWGWVLSWKNPEFCSVGRTRSQNSIFFAFLRYPSTFVRTAYMKQFYPKPVVPMESSDSEGVPFASLESLWPGINNLADIGPWRVPKSGHVSTWPSRKLKICI